MILSHKTNSYLFLCGWLHTLLEGRIAVLCDEVLGSQWSTLQVFGFWEIALAGICWDGKKHTVEEERELNPV